VRAEVVDRRVGLAIEEDGHEPAAGLVGAALAGGNVAHAGHGSEGDVVGGGRHGST
jgi:hypothetical protein